MTNFSQWLCFCLSVMAGSLVAAESNPPAVYVACISCHGQQAEGNPVIPVPPLAGQHAEYLRMQLLAFRNGHRGSHASDIWGRQMALMAKPLTDADIDQLALFLAALPPWVGAEQAPSSTFAGAGACTQCHQSAGVMTEASIPIITGMPEQYLYRQLLHYRDGLRGASVAGATNPMSALIRDDMTDAMLKDLARFFAGVMNIRTVIN